MLTDREKLGLRIEALRKRLGIKQTELGYPIGLDGPMVSRIENGGRDLTALELAGIARVLDVSVGDILKGLDVLGGPKKDDGEKGGFGVGSAIWGADAIKPDGDDWERLLRAIEAIRTAPNQPDRDLAVSDVRAIIGRLRSK